MKPRVLKPNTAHPDGLEVVTPKPEHQWLNLLILSCGQKPHHLTKVIEVARTAHVDHPNFLVQKIGSCLNSIFISPFTTCLVLILGLLIGPVV